ncbi:hypothetical protein [Microbacterium sp. CGR1]|uniref:hypothetical protein n=1 Tax=Microbacterium sp. CGR1 TaxID=1696072 RepID=UPI003DA21730
MCAVALAAVALTTALGCLAGCAPAPTPPTPTSTPAFASEEEAFAAAEEVYRAYNDAGNARRAGAADADPQRFLTGTALEADIDTQNMLLSRGLSAVGAASINSIEGDSSELSTSVASVAMIVCTDVSTLSLLDNTGANVTPPGRGDLVVLEVTFVGDRESLLISDTTTTDGERC